jgi:hypothetical protein
LQSGEQARKIKKWLLWLDAIEEVHGGFKPAEVNCLLCLAGENGCLLYQ